MSLNIVALVGNGVDLANGYKTSYENFHSWLNSEKKNLELYKQIDERSKWMNVEEELGNISLSKDYTAEDLINDKEQLQDDLREYLKDINDEIRTLSDELRKQNVVSFINNIGNNLLGTDKVKFRKFLGEYSLNEGGKNKKRINLNFVTLNYTYLLERCLYLSVDKFNDKPIEYQFLMPNYEIIGVNQVIHAHGDLNDSLIFGLNDSDQISNSIDETNGKYLIKQELDKMAMTTNFQDAVKAMSDDVNILVVSGASLGSTDKYWREQLIATLFMNKQCVLIVNVFVEGGLPKHSPMKMSKIINDEKNKFNKCFASSVNLKKIGGEGDNIIEEIEDRILIAPFSNETSNIANLKFDLE